MTFIQEKLAQRNIPPLRSREEMLKILAEEQYGPLPPKPIGISTQIIRKAQTNACGGTAVSEYMELIADMGGFCSAFPFRVVTPKGKPAGTVPLFIYLSFVDELPAVRVPVDELVENGFAVASIYYNDVSLDDRDGFCQGIAPEMIAHYGATSNISLWAWSACRVLDWALTQPEYDRKRIAVIGHSRLGKTALWAGANDERFACVISNDSGCCGAAITRNKQGEHIAIMAKAFPCWSVEAYRKYVDREEMMPFDQHWLLACVAPRGLCVGSATEDIWADPGSEYLGCIAAAPAWQGKAGTFPDRFPEPEECLDEGMIGYHLRTGCHDMAVSDWRAYMRFMEKHT